MMKYRKPATHAARLALLKNVLYRKHCMMVEIAKDVKKKIITLGLECSRTLPDLK